MRYSKPQIDFAEQVLSAPEMFHKLPALWKWARGVTDSLRAPAPTDAPNVLRFPQPSRADTPRGAAQ